MSYLYLTITSTFSETQIKLEEDDLSFHDVKKPSDENMKEEEEEKKVEQQGKEEVVLDTIVTDSLSPKAQTNSGQTSIPNNVKKHGIYVYRE